MATNTPTPNSAVTPVDAAPAAASLSAEARQICNDVSLAVTLLRGALAATGGLEDQVEHEMIARQVQAVSQDLSNDGARERRAAVRAMREHDVKFDEIAARLGLSRTRVNDLGR